MTKKVSSLTDSSKSLLPRKEKATYLWDNQHDEPDTEIVGVIAVSQTAKQNVGGYLHHQANFYPSSHHKDDRFITDKDGSVNPEIQAQLAWLGAQILGMSQLEITGSEMLGAAFNLEVLNPSPGVYQIQLTYPTITDGADGADGADGLNLYLRETSTGLMQSNEPDYDPETLIYAYYRADATRRATAFLAQANDSRLVLYNASAVQKLALGIVSGVNELDTRESQLLVRFGASTTNTRRVYFNTDGTIQFVNSVVTPTAKFEVFNDVSALDVAKFEGRTGQATGTAVLHLGVVNQEGSGFDGDAIRVRGLNSVTATRSPGIMKVDKHGRLLNSDHHQLQVLSTGVTPAVYKVAAQRTATLLSASGSNYLSRSIDTLYKDGSPIETMRQEILSDAAPAIGFLGHTAQERIDIGVLDCAGNEAAYTALNALVAFGLIDGTVSLGDAPVIPETLPMLTRCQIATALPLWIYSHMLEFAVREATYDDILYDVGTRTTTIKNTLDVFIPDTGALLGWVNDEWTNIGVAPDEAAVLFRLVDIRDYCQSAETARRFYCALDDNGKIDDVGYLGLLALLEGSGDISEPETSFYNFMRSLDAGSISVLTAQLAYSDVVDPDPDCSTFDCELWSLGMSFNLDDWSDATDLITGDYESGIGYTAYDGAVLGIEFPYHIIAANFRVCYNEADLTAAEIRVQNLDTAVWTNITPLINCKTYEYAESAPLGIKIEITAPSGTDLGIILERVFLTGLGTAPEPD